MSDSTDEARRKDAIEGLRFALADQQETIRAADLKAEVLAVVLTALLAIAGWEGGLTTSSSSGCLSIAAALAALIALVFVGGVLWPRSNPRHGIPLGGYTPSGVVYPPATLAPAQNVSTQAQAALGTDWLHELTYELLKLSTIRNRKQGCFRAALVASAICLLAVAVRLFVARAGAPTG